MRIGCIGAGAIALAFARYAVASGHEVVLSNRSGQDKLKNAISSLGTGVTVGTVTEAAQAEIVLLAIPWASVESVLSTLSGFEQRILIDATNDFLPATSGKSADQGSKPSSETVSSLVPTARCVKAFNCISAANLAAGPRKSDARRIIFIAGNDVKAKTTVADLIRGFGFVAMDFGNLVDGGRLLQPGGPMMGRDILIGR